MRRRALVFMLPAIETGGVERSSVRISDYVKEIDGLVLQGGADVSPISYGETPVRPEWSGDRVRDLYEMELFWECVVQGKPVLGICRGLQLINVALGGSLYQDIATEHPDAILHVDAILYDQHRHTIRIEENSRLAVLYANHDHPWSTAFTSGYQTAGARLGRRGCLRHRWRYRAIRMRGSSTYVTAFQWHPEFHGGASGCWTPAILDDFLAAAEKQRM